MMPVPREDAVTSHLDRSWSCYPNGPELPRRRFLRSLAIAAAGASVGFRRTASAQSAAVDNDVLSTEDVVAFPEGAVRLNFNENPIGPSPRAIAAILEDGLGESNRYSYVDPLTKEIARRNGVGAENVLMGCGSTEFLQIAPWTFLGNGGRLVLPKPTYSWCAGVAGVMGAEVTEVPLLADGTLALEAMKRALGPDTRLVYVANPDNPTGAGLPLAAIEDLTESLPETAVLLVDEAYVDFLPKGESSVSLVRKGAPVIVTRTFSKAFGLAGLRLGYVVAPANLIERLKLLWTLDMGVNSAANAGGLAALSDEAHVERYVKLVDEGLAYLRSGLSELGVETLPHRAPFFMAELGREAAPVVLALAREKVYVRDGKSWEMPTRLRISVGLPEENRVFLEKLEAALAAS
jgi:histidinol-phosphate aminotransferase